MKVVIDCKEYSIEKFCLDSRSKKLYLSFIDVSFQKLIETLIDKCVDYKENLIIEKYGLQPTTIEKMVIIKNRNWYKFNGLYLLSSSYQDMIESRCGILQADFLYDLFALEVK